MDFLNEFSKRVSSVARSVSEKSRESAEVTRMNDELRAAMGALEKLYARYGKVCYAARLGANNRQEAEQLAERIRAAQLEVEEAAARRDAAREMKRCPGCGIAFPKEARFCSSCGKRLPEAAPRPEPMAPGEYCPGCGARRENGEAVCPVCGAPFDAPAEPTPEPAADPDVAWEGSDVEEPTRDDAGSWE